MRVKSMISALCLGALAVDATASVQRGDLMPEGDVLLRVTGAKQLRADFHQAFGEQLLNDERFNAFTAALAEKIRRKAEDGKAPFELLQTLETLKHLEGEILFVQSNADGARACLAAAATQETFELILERTEWLHRQHEDYFTRERDEFQNTELTHDIINGGATNESHLWMCHEGATLLMANDRTWIEKSVVRLRNDRLRDEPPDSGLTLTLPVGAWARAAANALETDKAIERKTLLQALGLWDLGTYRIGWSFVDGNMIFDGVLSADDMDTGLFTLLDRSPEKHADNRIIPSDATSFTFGKLNLNRLWRDLPSILAGLAPRKAMGVGGAIDQFQRRSGLDVEHDLLAHMGNRYSLSTTMVGTNQAMVVAWELTNGDAMEQSIAKLLASPLAASWSSLIEATNFRGQTLFALKNKRNPGEGPTLAATDDWLILALKADLIRDILLRLTADDERAPSELVARVRAHAPANAFGFGGMNHQKTSGLLKVSVTDSSFSAGFGFSSKPDKNGGQPPAENEISLRYLTTFLGNTYHFAEAVPGGLHHQLIFESAKTKGAQP